MHDPVATGPGQHLVSHLVLRPHPGTQDVLPTPLVLLQRCDRLLADHAPIRHDADPAHPEPTAQAIHHGDQRGHIGGVARPQFAADRPALTIEHRPDDHLVEVGPMVLAEAALADVLAALALEVNRCGVEEDQLQVGEEVPAPGEHLLLDPVLDAAGGERSLVLLLVLGQFLTEPGHDPVEVVELQGFTPVDLVVRLPRVGGPVAPGGEEAMEHRQEDRPLDVALEAASVQELLDSPWAPRLSPEPLEDEGGSDAAGGEGRELSLGVSGEEEDGLSQPSARDQQGVELTTLLQLVESSQGGDDPLAGPSILPAVLNDLEIGAWAGGLGAEEHGALVVGTP